MKVSSVQTVICRPMSRAGRVLQSHGVGGVGGDCGGLDSGGGDE